MTSRPPFIGQDWALGEDGRWFRRGARVVLLDAADRVLLVRAHDVDDPGRSWWFTVGGGIDAGEDALDAARREALEEVGIRLAREDLLGPVLTRAAVFDFARVACRQDETFFLARVDAHDAPGADRSAWTAIEHETVDEVRWLDVEELAAVGIEVYPEGLVDLVRGWIGGWDGSAPHIDATRIARRDTHHRSAGPAG